MATQRLPRIAFLPGEGVGPEVVAQARRVLYALRGPGFDFEALDAPPNAVGALATDAWGEPLPPATLALAQSADAVLFGSVGDPRHDHLPVHLRPERAILGLRRGLGLYASLRHIAITGPLEALSPLKAERVRGVDLLVVRELDGDAYTGGKITDPKSGKVYSAKATVANGGKSLQVRGFMGISALGRTQTWQRVQ